MKIGNGEHIQPKKADTPKCLKTVITHDYFRVCEKAGKGE